MKELLGQVPLRGGPVRDLAGGLIRGLLLEPPRRTELFFLFTGDAPLELTLQYRDQTTLKLVPRRNSALHASLLRRWWEEYTATPGLLTNKADYPPLVENYLKAMLASRLELPLPEKKKTTLQDQLEKQFGMSMSTESARIAMERDEMLERSPQQQLADEPLPKPFDVPPLELPEVAKDVEVDPLAMRVPEECFYVRFGSFPNFLWFQDMLATWGGDLQNLLALRGLDHEIRQRMEKQLVLRRTVLAKLLGDTVVADVAIIGTDLYLEDGGAFGLLFLAKNNMMLTGDLKGQRAERLRKKDGITEEKVTIGGREVSYLSTPDGSVRSYYVSDGNYHFVTTSKTLIRRFLETAFGKGALGTSDEFRYARTVLPQSRQDTVFIYLSDAFFRNLVGPHYQIELARRVRSAADIELVRLASLASAAEGKPDGTLEELSEGGFLPPKVRPARGRQPDGASGREGLRHPTRLPRAVHADSRRRGREGHAFGNPRVCAARRCLPDQVEAARPGRRRHETAGPGRPPGAHHHRCPVDARIEGQLRAVPRVRRPARREATGADRGATSFPWSLSGRVAGFSAGCVTSACRSIRPAADCCPWVGFATC